MSPLRRRNKSAADGKRKRKFQWPQIHIDLSQSKHRRNVVLAAAGLFVGTILFLVGSYEGYHYTESSEFCGEVCHPMAPQFSRYQSSDHSNVDCVKCHIGPGAESFVRSKLDGMRQVYAVLTDSYSRPITSPIHNLRPARETCETCHTPTSFKDNIVKTIVHYDNDEGNTKVLTNIILKMGGWQETTGVSQGIHWHITNPVYYIAADAQRQVITWIGVEDEDGNITEYFARDMLAMATSDYVEEARESGELREMDCIDCHNRAAHDVPPPSNAVDMAINLRIISSDLPYIRAKSVELLTTTYESNEEAYTAIEANLTAFYEAEYPYVISEMAEELDAAIEELKGIYESTNFPEMNLTWATNPNNETHTMFLGCFRCHDDKHVQVDEAGNEGVTISVKCNLCHTVPIVGRGDNILVEAPVIVGPVPETHSDFRWTVDHRGIDAVEEQSCYDCHGRGFCDNGACHNLEHPEDMLFSHADIYRESGEQVCYTCHQNVLCSRCHPGGIVSNP